MKLVSSLYIAFNATIGTIEDNTPLTEPATNSIGSNLNISKRKSNFIKFNGVTTFLGGNFSLTFSVLLLVNYYYGICIYDTGYLININNTHATIYKANTKLMKLPKPNDPFTQLDNSEPNIEDAYSIT